MPSLTRSKSQLATEDDNQEEAKKPKFDGDPNMNNFYRNYHGERLVVRGKLMFLFMLQMLLVWFIFLESQTDEFLVEMLTT